MLGEFKSTCIDGLKLDSYGRLFVDKNVAKHKVANGVYSIINNVVDDYFKIDYDGGVGGVCKLYKLDGVVKILQIGDTLYEFRYSGSYTIDLHRLGIIRDIVGIMFDMCLGVKEVIDVIKLINSKVFINRDDYFKVKYIENGGYIIYLNDKYVIGLSNDLGTLSGYKIETSHKINGIDIRFIGEYVGDSVSIFNTYSTLLLWYTLLEDLETEKLKVLEFSGINYCRVVDYNDIDYFRGTLKVDGDTLQSIYFDDNDLLQHSRSYVLCRSYVLWYKGKLYVLLNCTESCIDSLVKDRDRFIEWYNSGIDKGWDYSMINSLLNCKKYRLVVVTDVVSKSISLKVVKVGYDNAYLEEYFNVGVGDDGKLII